MLCVVLCVVCCVYCVVHCVLCCVVTIHGFSHQARLLKCSYCVLCGVLCAVLCIGDTWFLLCVVYCVLCTVLCGDATWFLTPSSATQYSNAFSTHDLVSRPTHFLGKCVINNDEDLRCKVHVINGTTHLYLRIYVFSMNLKCRFRMDSY